MIERHLVWTWRRDLVLSALFVSGFAMCVARGWWGVSYLAGVGAVTWTYNLVTSTRQLARLESGR